MVTEVYKYLGKKEDWRQIVSIQSLYRNHILTYVQELFVLEAR